jgi:tRNA-dihydrouridine synthase A
VQGLYAGLPNARSWRRYLTERGHLAGAGSEVLRDSLQMFRQAA